MFSNLENNNKIIIYFGIIYFSNELIRLILSEITNQEYTQLNFFNIVIYSCLIFATIFDNIIYEFNLLDNIIIPLLIIYIIYYIQFVISVTNILADILNIKIFKVKKEPHKDYEIL